MTLISFRRKKSEPDKRMTEDQRRFARGTRTIADLLAPASAEVERDHLRLEYQFARSLALIAYPRTVEAGWLRPLVTSEDPIEISMHVHPLDTGQMIKMLHHKLVQLESSRRITEKNERLDNAERQIAVEDIVTLWGCPAARRREGLLGQSLPAAARWLGAGTRAADPQRRARPERRVSPYAYRHRATGPRLPIVPA